MMNLDEFTQRRRLSEFTLRNENNVVFTRLGISISLLLKQTHIHAKKVRIIECYRRFMAEFSDRLCFHRHEFDNMKKFNAENIAKIENIILESGPETRCGWYVSDAKNKDVAPTCVMRYLGTSWDSEEECDNTGYLTLILPWDYINTDIGLKKFHEWVVFLCEKLEPQSGDCGYCLTIPRDYHQYMSMEYQLALRYPSLSVISTIHLQDIANNNNLKTINWITILDHSLVKRLGGAEWLEKLLHVESSASVSRFSHGLIIQATEYPDLMPVSEGLNKSYQAVNKLLRPIRVPPEKIDSLHLFGANQFTNATSIVWYARFDE
ncbi:hypothetical protein SOASR030_12440 [Leminorella grimontii]|uniref:DUF3396 domain-containing protein n=1 Tax=Leminorella grimontii TaxID=82981 RepID=A0AAV5N085_9GAMM|nr:type VI immunity family protein [Leminorella grimontii]KFC97507.1 hypothetical protein GLGR_0442 [Leminorella grimontii ATCC 33999 = DSM 5078]GKX55132.1 hypothetical protein SOASR030_12440 [Leminorella grimontii]VFS56853.1 Protein of uncharacterised function (DUF3396) [Leminorella grimontii]